MVRNKIVRLTLMGGLLGLLLTNPRRALEGCIEQHNNEGWRSTFIVPHSERNLLISSIQIVMLIVTLGMWTFGSGYLVMFEKEDR